MLFFFDISTNLIGMLFAISIQIVSALKRVSSVNLDKHWHTMIDPILIMLQSSYCTVVMHPNWRYVKRQNRHVV